MARARRPARGLSPVSRLQDELDWAIARAGEIGDEERPSETTPPIDVVETADAIVIFVEVAGIAATDLEVEAAGSRLLVRGRRRSAATGPGPVRFHCMERGRGDFQRLVELVGALDTHAARARLVRGVLQISIPKIDDRRRQPRRIEIESEDR